MCSSDLGKYLDEIPLQREIKINTVASADFEKENPIASDAAISLFRKHQLLASDFRATDSKLGDLSGTLRSDVNFSREKKSWLESPVFWGIVGGILAGGAITYFATRDNSPGTTTSDWE